MFHYYYFISGTEVLFQEWPFQNDYITLAFEEPRPKVYDVYFGTDDIRGLERVRGKSVYLAAISLTKDTLVGTNVEHRTNTYE